MRLRERSALIAIGVCVLAAAAYVLIPGRPSAPSTDPNGVPETGGMLFPDILGIADAAFGGERWYLADPRANRIHVLTRDGRYVRGFGRTGGGPGEFFGPTVLAASDTRVFLAQRGRPDVSVFDSAGIFIGLLMTPPGCRGSVAQMVAVRGDLYVLRRCVELPERLWYRVERSLAGGGLHVMSVAGDTVVVPQGSGMPLQVPLLAAAGDRLVLGDGGRSCLRIFRLPDGRPSGERCLTEVPRRPIPEREQARVAERSRGRVVVPDSLPRILDLFMTDTSLVVQAVDDVARVTWLALSWIPAAAPTIQVVGRPRVEQSFMAPGIQLVAWDDEQGTRLEVLDGIH